MNDLYYVGAEGVEIAAQAQFLASIWCEHAQGYFYSKPLPAAEFALWLASGQSMGTKTVTRNRNEFVVVA